MSSYINTALSYVRALQTGRNLTAEVVGDDGLEMHPKSHCQHVRSIEGRLWSKQLPVEGQKVNFYIKDFSNFKHFIGSARSNQEGDFKLRYTWTPGLFSRSQRIVMEVVEERLPFSKEGLLCVKNDVLLQRIERKVSLENKIDFECVELTYSKTSQDLTAVPPPLPNHTQSPHYFVKFFKAAFPEAVKKLIVSLASPLLTTSAVQRIYDFGSAYPKRALTSENLLEELLNHVSAVGARVEDQQVVWEASWDGYQLEQQDTLPNVRVRASKNDGVLKLDSIVIKFPNEAEETVVSALDGNLPWAIYVARSVFALAGEARFHLAEGHILPGVCAQEFFTYIKPEHPLFSVLQPHLSQLDFINWLGSKGIIFGSGSVLDISALTADSVAKVIIDHVKLKADWVQYQPQEPLAANHYLAKGEKFHFNLLQDFFREYIGNNRDAIVRDWEAIHSWSEAMHGHLEALPRLTATTDQPTEEDLNNLAKFCAWLVSKTTFLHWAAHSRQQLLTDVMQASLAMEDKGHGTMQVKAANQQLFVARTLLNFDGDSIFKNPYGDLHPRLLALLNEHKAKYEGYEDIEKMFITTQI
ncbi:MAG: hypothetical protein JSR37_10010 [Verrucomicrobia bacterium]|nr:hypothetical protein [Verrucomicrobiota bacterium]